MGSFKGHAVPGTLFLVIGVWHMWCSVYRYVSNPKGFQIRAWNPVPGFDGRLKYLELYMVTIGSFFDLCIELLYATNLTFFVNGVLNPSHMNNFEHSGMLVMFFIFGLISLLSETTRFLPLTQGALCLIAASAFCAEYLLFYFHSTNHKGLEGYYHLILVLLIGLCVITSIAGTLIPDNFPLDLCNAMAVTLQGLWFYQTAFTLYGPMMPNGCQLKDDNILCHLPENQVRGELLANFQLFSLVFGVVVIVVISFGFAVLCFGRSSDLVALHIDDGDVDRESREKQFETQDISDGTRSRQKGQVTRSSRKRCPGHRPVESIIVNEFDNGTECTSKGGRGQLAKSSKDIGHPVDFSKDMLDAHFLERTEMEKDISN